MEAYPAGMNIHHGAVGAHPEAVPPRSCGGRDRGGSTGCLHGAVTAHPGAMEAPPGQWRLTLEQRRFTLEQRRLNLEACTRALDDPTRSNGGLPCSLILAPESIVWPVPTLTRTFLFVSFGCFNIRSRFFIEFHTKLVL
jgi:hypothetical protein